MKFTARLDESHYMRELLNVINTVSKLTKECVLHLHTDRVGVVANEETNTFTPLFWVNINSEEFFAEYTIQGSTDDTEQQIVLIASPLHLCRAFASLKSNAIRCHIKLITLQYDCLRVEVEVPAFKTDQVRQLINDVPVTILLAEEREMYRMPRIPNTPLILSIGQIRLLRNLLERMDHLAPSITFGLSSDGELYLTVNTDMADVTTRYKGQEVIASSHPASFPPSNRSHRSSIEKVTAAAVPIHRVTCPVDCKKVANFLSALQVTIEQLICGIDQDRFLYFTVSVQEGLDVHAVFTAVDI